MRALQAAGGEWLGAEAIDGMVQVVYVSVIGCCGVNPLRDGAFLGFCSCYEGFVARSRSVSLCRNRGRALRGVGVALAWHGMAVAP